MVKSKIDSTYYKKEESENDVLKNLNKENRGYVQEVERNVLNIANGEDAHESKMKILNIANRVDVQEGERNVLGVINREYVQEGDENVLNIANGEDVKESEGNVLGVVNIVDVQESERDVLDIANGKYVQESERDIQGVVNIVDVQESERDVLDIGNGKYVQESERDIQGVVNIEDVQKGEIVLGNQAEPPDGGWGWVVLFAVFVTAIILIGTDLCFGIIFGDLLIQMKVSSTFTAIILNVHHCLVYVFSMITGALCENYGWRRVAFTGTFINSVGYMLLATVSTPTQLFFLYSIILGMTSGIGSAVPFLVVPSYFHKKRGAAMATLSSGIALGLVLVPPGTRYLIDEFGFKGAAMILGAILGNCCAAAMTFHPIEWHQKNRNDLESVPNKNFVDKLKKEHDADDENSRNVAKLFILKSVEIVTTVLNHILKLKYMKILIVTSSFAGFIVSYINFLSILPIALETYGHSLTSISWCISLASVFNAAVRISVVLISDKKWFSRKFSFIFGCLSAGIFEIAISMCLHNLTAVQVLLIPWAMSIAMVVSTYFALAIDVCGRELYVSCYTAGELLHAILFMTFGPGLGVLRDYTSYTVSLSTCGALKIFSFTLWLLMPLALKRDQRLKKK